MLHCAKPAEMHSDLVVYRAENICRAEVLVECRTLAPALRTDVAVVAERWG
jgi:hypothetical protein